MRVLFDQATPLPIRTYLTKHTVRTAAEQRWSELRNGDLLRVAEAEGFEVLLTTDKNMRYQQNLNEQDCHCCARAATVAEAAPARRAAS